MRQEYQRQYRAEVESLAEKGFELYFLNGEALRTKIGKSNTGMSAELVGQVSAFCHSSLAVTELTAEALSERLGKPDARASRRAGVKGALKAN